MERKRPDKTVTVILVKREKRKIEKTGTRNEIPKVERKTVRNDR